MMGGLALTCEPAHDQHAGLLMAKLTCEPCSV